MRDKSIQSSGDSLVVLWRGRAGAIEVGLRSDITCAHEVMGAGGEML